MNIHIRRLGFALVVGLLIVLAGCGGGEDEQESYEGRALRPGEFGLEVSAAPIARMDEPFSARIPVGGGVAPFRFEVISGALPPGLSFDGKTGAFKGRPTQLGRFELRIRVTDAKGARTRGRFSLTVIEQDAPSTPSPPSELSQALPSNARAVTQAVGVVSTAGTMLGGATRVDAPLQDWWV